MSRVRPIRFIAVLLGVWWVAQGAAAANLELSGSASWQISGSSIDISAAEVSNESPSGVSGTIRLQIWATAFPYAGGTITGYVLGTRTLGTLAAGYYYSGISGFVPYTPPPSGLYYTTLTVEEYTGSGYVIRDYLTFNGTSQLGGGGGGGGGTGPIDLLGSVGWSISRTKIEITAETIANNRSGGSSGTLRLEIWATTTPYSGGTINGYVMGTRTLGTLSAGYSFNNVSGYVSYTAPPPGTYYTTIALEEYTASGYVIVDYVTFTSTATFGSGSGGGVGSGGGFGGDLQLVGSARYKISRKKGALLTVEEVLNGRLAGVSGTLRLQLWATSTPYAGGPINGYVLATRGLGQLAAGYYYYDIGGTVPYYPPPGGTYFLTMTLEEYDGSYLIVDYLTFPKLLKVK